jgi:hypothetical protein
MNQAVTTTEINLRPPPELPAVAAIISNHEKHLFFVASPEPYHPIPCLTLVEKSRLKGGFTPRAADRPSRRKLATRKLINTWQNRPGMVALMEGA